MGETLLQRRAGSSLTSVCFHVWDSTGSSTGCQQIMQYLLSPHISGKTRSPISKGILQAPGPSAASPTGVPRYAFLPPLPLTASRPERTMTTVSDRECFLQEVKAKAAAELAQSLHTAGKDEELMPSGSLDWGPDVTVYRAWSLLCEGSALCRRLFPSCGASLTHLPCF
jgi:hypothetical protein